MIRLSMLFLLSILFVQTADAQNFLEPIESFSRKKPCYITLKTGEEIEAEFRNSKTKKGLILKIWVNDGKEEKREIEADDIKFMYMPVSGWEKFSKAMELDLTKEKDDSSLNQELIQDGYAYFETVEVMVKKKKQTALMQLLNPAYANKVRVYHNPWASETASLNYGGVKLAGGDAKSYYVKSGDKIAFLVQKKNYDDLFQDIFGSCKSFVKENPKPRWKDFEQNVYDHAKACAE